MRVLVYETDQKTIIGLGEMHREDVQVVDDNDNTKILCTLKDHPHITLDKGGIVLGCECWWEPV
jgi:hypothetical protein